MHINKKPDHVIRFYCNTDFALETIALKQITFIRVDQLNDPFDPVLDIDSYIGNDLYSSIENEWDKLSEMEKRNRMFQSIGLEEKDKKLQTEEAVNIVKKTFNDLKENMYIFSTCEVKAGSHPSYNLYMWGHYANGHRGVAIEFDTEALVNSLKEQDSQISMDSWCKMDYREDIHHIRNEVFIKREISGNRNELLNSIKEIFRFKSKVWEVEKEWRLVWLNENKTRLKLQRCDLDKNVNNCITAVYLGCRVDKQVCEDFILETQRNFPKANIYRAEIKQGEFALSFNKLV